MYTFYFLHNNNKKLTKHHRLYNASQSVCFNWRWDLFTYLKSASLSSVCKHLKGLFETNVCTCCPLHTTQPKISTSTKGVKSPDNAVLNKKEKPLSRVQIYTKHIFFTTFRSDKQQGTAFYWIPSLNRLNPPRWQRFTELSSTFN